MHIIKQENETTCRLKPTFIAPYRFNQICEYPAGKDSLLEVTSANAFTENSFIIKHREIEMLNCKTERKQVHIHCNQRHSLLVDKDALYF
jgi:hypothetical protein